MHCVACDKVLSNIEASRKSRKTGEYLDMCNLCYSSIADSLDTTTNQTFINNTIGDHDDDYSNEDYQDHELDEI